MQLIQPQFNYSGTVFRFTSWKLQTRLNTHPVGPEGLRNDVCQTVLGTIIKLGFYLLYKVIEVSTVPIKNFPNARKIFYQINILIIGFCQLDY